MNKNNSNEYNPLLEVAIYNQLFSDFIAKYVQEKQILPEITDPILKAYESSKESTFAGLLYAFVAGVEAGRKYLPGYTAVRHEF